MTPRARCVASARRCRLRARLAARALPLAMALLAGLPGAAAAQQRYAVVIAGASGGEPYASKLAGWRAALVRVLRERLQFDTEHLLVFGEAVEPGATGATAAPAVGPLEGTPGVPRPGAGGASQARPAAPAVGPAAAGEPPLQPPTRDAVRAAFDRLVRVLGPEDLLLVVLLGHGTWDGVDAKFNLVGPDLDAGEWRELLRPVRARVVLVNTTGASFPFLERLAGPKRIVITATASAAQRYDTVFPEYFIESLGDPAADLDKDGRVSLLEAFSAASRRVRQHYDERGQLATERALLDDTGDGIGKEAGAAGPDGAVAARTFFDAAVTPSAADPVLADLLQRRAALEAQVDELRARRPLMPAEDYAREFERLMIELARISREIRKRS